MNTIAKYVLLLTLILGCQGKEDKVVERPAQDEPEPNFNLNGTPTKLGLHLLGFVLSKEAKSLLDACPPVAKWIAGYASSYIGEFKRKCPASTVILRVYVDNEKVHYKTSDDPKKTAEQFWKIMQDDIARNSIDQKNIDWLEGPNELDNVPDWYHDWEAAVWFAKVWDHLADLMHNAGYNPLVGSVSSANPSLEGEQKDQAHNPRPNFMQPLADVMKLKDYPIGWSYHSYARYTNFDAEIEKWYTLRYRRIIEETGLQNYPLYITEAGISWQGWKKVDPKYAPISADQYFKWLVWLDERFAEDDAVKGVTLWQIGDMGDWQTDDLTPLAGKLEKYIRDNK